MKVKKQAIRFSDGSKGVYALSPDITHTNELVNWITHKDFDNYENQGYRLERHTRNRNRLYSFQHPLLSTEVILKVSRINDQHKLLRRLNLYLSTFFSDYNYRAFLGAYLLKVNGISCAAPIAYWTETENFLIKKSYYLYEKIHAEHSIYSLSQQLFTLDQASQSGILSQLAEKITMIIRNIHDAGFRQGDPHPGNFLISLPNQDTKEMTSEDLDQAKIYIIDLDKFNVAMPLGTHLKRFFDIRCLRRCTLGNFDQHAMLKFYLQSKYSKTWDLVLRFWMRGGFNISKWFKPLKKRL